MPQKKYSCLCYNCGPDKCWDTLYAVCPECLELIELGREYREILRSIDEEVPNVTKTNKRAL